LGVPWGHGIGRDIVAGVCVVCVAGVAVAVVLEVIVVVGGVRRGGFGVQ